MQEMHYGLQEETRSRDLERNRLATEKLSADAANAVKATYVDSDGTSYPVNVTARGEYTRVTIPTGMIDRRNSNNNKPKGASELNRDGTGGSGFSLDTTLDNFKATYLTRGKRFTRLGGEELPGYFTQSTGGRSRHKTRARKSRRQQRKTRRYRK